MIITIGRKPFETTTIENVKTHECGGINIDACRIGDELRFNQAAGTDNKVSNVSRFPANVVLSSSVTCHLPEATQGHWAKAKVTGYGSSIGQGTQEYFGVGEKDKEGGSVAKYFFIVRE